MNCFYYWLLGLTTGTECFLDWNTYGMKGLVFSLFSTLDDLFLSWVSDGVSSGGLNGMTFLKEYLGNKRLVSSAKIVVELDY
jgi:hypothetical protein